MRFLMIISTLCLGLASCGGSATHSLTGDQSGEQVSVDPGEVIEVTLESNPSTGYVWEIVMTPEMIELSGDEYVAPGGDLVGEPGSHTFMFNVLDDGAGVLRLEYIRPFEDPAAPERVVEYIVVVGDAVWPPEPTGSSPGTSTATAPIDVGDLADAGPGDVTVRGFVIWDDSSARLCELLLESYPPQCGGASIEIADPESLGVELEEAQGVRWTPNAVTLGWMFDGEHLTHGE
jgi:inhibitor of cysteine peptidase